MYWDSNSDKNLNLTTCVLLKFCLGQMVLTLEWLHKKLPAHGSASQGASINSSPLPWGEQALFDQ